MQYKLKPYPHQLKALDLAEAHRDVGLLWEMGAGKTGGVINILRTKYAKKGRVMRTLILSPLVTLHNWKDEFKIHSYMDENNIHILAGSSAKKLKKFMDWSCNKETGEIDGDYIYITNYESLNSAKLFDLLQAWGPEIIISDEAHYLKNPKAKRTKAAVKLGDKSHHNFILTGTPILNSVKDIFGMFRFLDRGDTFGKNHYVFINTYMQDDNAGWSGKANHFPKLVERPEMYDELTKKIYTKCDRVLKKDVIKDLPPLVKKVHHVELSKNQMKYYKEMERDFITFVQEKEKKKELSGAVVAQLAVTKALRLQQIVTGHVTTEEGEIIYIEDNPRLEEVSRLVDEIVVENGHKCILWCSFRANYRQLGKMCEEKKIEPLFLTGEQNLEQKRDAMDKFNKDKNYPIIIANRRAGGIGINLVAASYSIVYSRNFSLADELQSEARNHRGGSQIHASITKIDLAAPNTVDARVLEALKNKQDISNKIIDIVRSE